MVSIHAAEELDDDNLTILDLENIILTGEIIERQGRRAETRSVFRRMVSDENGIAVCVHPYATSGGTPTASALRATS